MSILEQRLNRDRLERESAVQEISECAVNPTVGEQELADQIIQQVSEQYKEDISRHGFTADIKTSIREFIHEQVEQLEESHSFKARVEKIVTESVTGYGPIDRYLHDPEISEIVVQRYNNICVEVGGKIQKVNVEFLSEEHLVTVINRIIQPVGRQINLHTPTVDARFSDGSRVNAVIPPVSPDGAMLTIRRFPEKIYTGNDYLRFQSLNDEMLYFLMKAVEGRASIIVSGGTGSGKTTLLNMLSLAIPPAELIVTIEDSCELKLAQPNVRRLESRILYGENTGLSVTIQNLVKNAMRMRPDRLIVGEVRDGTIVDMIAAMSTGHEGSLSTCHANSPFNLVNARIPILYSMYSSDFSAEAQAMQVAEALDLIVHIDRMKDGSRKITAVTHVAGMENKRVRLRDIYTYDGGRFKATGYVPRELLEKMEKRGVTVDHGIFKGETKEA